MAHDPTQRVLSMFFPTRRVHRHLPPLVTGPGAMALAAIAFAMQWRVYARAIRATTATPS